MELTLSGTCLFQFDCSSLLCGPQMYYPLQIFLLIRQMRTFIFKFSVDQRINNLDTLKIHGDFQVTIKDSYFIRSEDMRLFKTVIATDNAWEVMNELGKLNAFHFHNMNSDEQAFNLPYANMVKRVEDSQRKLEYVQI
jgi:hypothetical protein